jgi:hypothetical protein
VISDPEIFLPNLEKQHLTEKGKKFNIVSEKSIFEKKNKKKKSE